MLRVAMLESVNTLDGALWNKECNLTRSEWVNSTCCFLGRSVIDEEDQVVMK